MDKIFVRMGAGNRILNPKLFLVSCYRSAGGANPVYFYDKPDEDAGNAGAPVRVSGTLVRASGRV